MRESTATTGSNLAIEEKTFLRFDIHQRIQHWAILSSFIICMLTGWPLKMAGVGASKSLVALFGSLEACGTVHRVSAAIMLLACVYHLLYLGMRWRRKDLNLSMVPSGKDFRDLVHNIKYYLRLRKSPPKYGHWSYFEKFDYWAVFWGIIIMGGSGLILWFPTFFMSFLPPWMLSLSHIAHSDEALLAGLAIFIWHFYNVHLRAAVFPMNWVWLTGRLSEEAMKAEHGEEYDQLMAEEAAAEGSAEAQEAAETEPTPDGEDDGEEPKDDE